MSKPKPVALSETEPRVVAARAKAQEALDKEVEKYEKQRREKPSTDDKWMRTVLASGTLTDKVAAMALLVQSSPQHGLRSLDNLMALAKKKSRRESVLAADTLADLFANTLLPDRDLLWFHEQPGVVKASTPVDTLKDWLYEDHLKRRFREFVDRIEAAALDGISHFKLAAMKRAVTLATAKPELRRSLIHIVVNKLGDQEKKVASTASYLLSQLIGSDTVMTTAVVGTVQQMVLRDKVSARAQYYGVLFLNQLVLSKSDATIPNHLMKIYFALFESCVASGTEVKSRLLSALLAGVNRAFPFMNLGSEFLTPRVDMLFRLVHASSFNTSVQALMLLFKVTSQDAALADRFYRSLYASLLSPDLPTSSKHSLYLNLLYKAMKADPIPVRVQATMKRLAQVAFHAQANFAAGALFIMSEVLCRRAEVCVMVVKKPKPQPQRAIEAHKVGGGDVKHAPVTEYDPVKREPKFAGAEFSCFWELAPLAVHFHPSVRKFAEQLMVNPGVALSYDGDPLEDFSLMAFLDRFAFRNPKKRNVVYSEAEAARKAKGSVAGDAAGPVLGEQSMGDVEAEIAEAYAMMAGEQDKFGAVKKGLLRGTSKMQPRLPKRGRVALDAPANSAQFRSLAPYQVREDDMFVYTFMKSRPEKAVGNPDVELTEEAEDEIADELAEKLMRDHAKSAGIADEDEDDFEDMEDEEDEEDEEGLVGMGSESGEDFEELEGEDFHGMGSESDEEPPVKAASKKKRKLPTDSVFADAEPSDLDE